MPRLHLLVQRSARLLVSIGLSPRAATAVEYGLIAALVVLAMIASFKDVANVTVGMWSNTQSKIANATGY